MNSKKLFIDGLQREILANVKMTIFYFFQKFQCLVDTLGLGFLTM